MLTNEYLLKAYKEQLSDALDLAWQYVYENLDDGCIEFKLFDEDNNWLDDFYIFDCERNFNQIIDKAMEEIEQFKSLRQSFEETYLIEVHC